MLQFYISFGPAVLFPGIYLRNSSAFPLGNMHRNIYCNIIYSREKQ